MYLMSLYLASSVTDILIQLCKIEKTVVKKSLILEAFPGPRFLMQNSLEKRFIAQKPTQSKNPFACCNCWHVLPFSLPHLILLHFFPGQKDSQLGGFEDPSYPFRTSDTTSGFLQPELDGFMLDPVMPGTGRSPNGAFCFPLQGQLWRLVGAAGHLLILAQQSPEGAQMSTWMCPFTSIIVSSPLPFHTPSAASQIFALKAPNLLLMLL